MSSNTPAVNSVTKVSVTASNGRQSPVQKDTGLDFNALFSSALGQNAPQARLNGIEQQLRESLYKQDKDQEKNLKREDVNPAAEAAQASVWAQRNWMQTPPSTPATGSENKVQTGELAESRPMQSNNAEQSPSTSQAQAQQADQAATPASTGKNPEDSQAATASNSSAAAAQDDSSAAIDINTPALPTDPTAPGMAAHASTPFNESVVSASTAALVASPTLPNGANPEKAQGGEFNTAPLQESRILTGTDQAGASARPEVADQANRPLELIADKANSTALASNRLEPPPVNDNAGKLGTQLAVNAQIAPQIAQQLQNLGETGQGEEGLKIGQKILGTGNLQGTGMQAGIAVGSNGLTTGGATGPQTQIKTPVNQPGFGRELGQTVQWAIGKNLSTVDIRVNPESFGPLNMRLVQKGQQVQLVIRTQDEASANLLTQALGGLKEVLAQNGLQLNQVQVQPGNPGGNPGQAATSNPQSDANHGQGQQGGHQAGGRHSAHAEVDHLPVKGPDKRPEGTLDLFA